jgi:hypothetical protein
MNHFLETLFPCCHKSPKSRRAPSINTPKISLQQSQKTVTHQETQGSTAPTQPGNLNAAPPVTGLRKPSVNRPKKTKESEPSKPEFLYFGPDGPDFSRRSHSVSGQPSQNSPSNTATAASDTVPARDDSGFLNTGIQNSVNSPMGYSNLTYGGSLQYDYAQTQGYGTPHIPGGY